MNKKTITKAITFFIPEYINEKDIISLIKKEKKLVAIPKFTLNNTKKTIMFKKYDNGNIFDNDDSDSVGSIHIERINHKGVQITKIKQYIEGFKTDEYMSFDEETYLLSPLINTFKGIATYSIYHSGQIYEQFANYHIVTFDRDSVEYKLTDLLFEDANSIKDLLALVESLKNKKTDILSIFSE